MQIKTDKDQIQNYLSDASNMPGGHADKLFIPENETEVREVLAEAFRDGVPVTVSGARTGTVGGAVPIGGWILSLEKLDDISIDKEMHTVTVGAGTILADIQTAVDKDNLFYPPDPTEWSCQIGGNAATDASGARSFKYGSTRNFVNALRIVLADGDTLSLTRGKFQAVSGVLTLVTDQGNEIAARTPTYKRRNVRKDSSGFYSDPELDAVDLFVGSEGLLGVITELELRLLPKPFGHFSGIVFFDDQSDLLNLVADVKESSFSDDQTDSVVDAALLEYFDRNALDFIRGAFPETPEDKTGAIFFEQQTTDSNEEKVFGAWNELLEKHNADLDSSWFAVNIEDEQRMRNFRHALPVTVNEKVVRNGTRKVGTDMAVPDDLFPQFLKFYQRILDESGIESVIFGHIGDSHLHANLLPKNKDEAVRARHIYGRCVAQALMYGGTVSAEHGIGKLKSKFLYVMFGERFVHEMAELKKKFDVKQLLNRGNMFDEKFLVI